MIYAVDFDGTIVMHKYPKIGSPVPNALNVLNRLQAEGGNKIILYTMRSGAELQAAVKYLEDRGISLYGINENPNQREWTDSPKVYAHRYIDDAAVGCPLIQPSYRSDRPWVDWFKIEEMIFQ